MREWMNSIDPTSRPRGRLGDDQHGVVAGQLAGDDHLLLVPARKGRHGHVDARGPHVVALDEVDGVLVDRRGLPNEPPEEGRPVVAVQHEVVGDTERTDEAVAVAVLGDVADAQVEDLSRAGTGDVDAVDVHRARIGVTHTRERLDQLSLAVALDAGDAVDLTGADREIDAVHRDQAALVGHDEVVPRAGVRRRRTAPCRPRS